MKDKDEEDMITLAEAARLRGVSYDSILKLVKRGRLRAKNFFGRLVVYRSEVMAFEKDKPGPRKGSKKAQ